MRHLTRNRFWATFLPVLMGAVWLAVAAAGLNALWSANRTSDQWRQRADALEADHARVEARLTEKSEYLHLLREDPAFAERQIRQKTGYLRPDETILYFKAPQRTREPAD